jgi:phosphoglycolate phosphatase
MPPPLRNLLFDLDGTLTDPGVGIIACVRHALAKLDRPQPAPDSLRWVVGPPLRDSFAGLLQDRDAATVEAAIAFYRERYATVGMYENIVYPGIPALLAAQRRAGRRLFVATSKPRVYALRIIEHFELRQHFAGVYGAGLDGSLSEKPALLAHLLAAERLDPAATAMIGDRRHDVAGARAVGIRAIAVGYGYGSAEELAAAAPDHVCPTVEALARLVGPVPPPAGATARSA